MPLLAQNVLSYEENTHKGLVLRKFGFLKYSGGRFISMIVRQMSVKKQISKVINSTSVLKKSIKTKDSR